MIYRFPKIKMLRGELKRSEIRNSIKYQLTTKEFIQQRTGSTYRIALDNIIGFVECDDKEFSNHAFHSFGRGGEKFGRAYKIVASVLHSVTQNGVIEQSNVSFYTRLSSPFAKTMENLLRTTQ